MSGTRTLAQRLEDDGFIRRLVRETQQLTRWRKTALIGVASQDHAVLNASVLAHVAGWWTEEVEVPQSIPIEAVREQVRFVETKS